MLVLYRVEPAMLLRKSSTSCYCGCSIPEPIGKTYCQKCTARRKTFVERIIGNIYGGQQGTTERKIIDLMEIVRKEELSEAIYAMIDEFFSDHQFDENYTEPYNDTSFLISAYNGKISSTDRFLASLPVTPVPNNDETMSYYYEYSKTILPGIYHYYSSEVSIMREQDTDELKSLKALKGGYKYQRKYPKR